MLIKHILLNAFTSRMSGRHSCERTKDWDATRDRQQGFFPPLLFGQGAETLSPTRRITPAGSGSVASTAGWDKYKSVQSQVFKVGRESKKCVCVRAFQYKLEKTTVTDGLQWVCNCVCYAHITEMGCLNHLSQKGGETNLCSFCVLGLWEFPL